MSVAIREEAEGDYARIAEVVEAAFGRPVEARLVEAIRASDAYVPELALVAVANGEVIGHVMFSYVTLRGDEERRALCMAPVSVAPAWQSRGAGGALVREGVARCDARGEPLVHVLGHPGDYPRFGFERARPLGIEPPSPQVPDAAFMAIKLSAYDARYRGRIVYPPAFDGT